jgi:hypothetical protein
MKNLFVNNERAQMQAISKTIKKRKINNASMGEETCNRIIDDLLLKVEAGISNFLSHATMEKAISLIENIQNLREREMRYRTLNDGMDKSE